MITAFSFSRNGWVNYHAPRRSISGVSAVPFIMSDARLNRERDRHEPGFAYATKEAAEAFDVTQPAIPGKEWAKVIPIWPNQVDDQ